MEQSVSITKGDTLTLYTHLNPTFYEDFGNSPFATIFM